MNIEDSFLQAIHASPSDITARLVYADWLDERSDQESVHRAEYLRAECELDARTKKKNKQIHELNVRLQTLRTLVGDQWWKSLDFARVERCVQFTFQCDQRWDTLALTEDTGIRHCSRCQKNVTYCHSVQEAEEHAKAGKCVAIDSRQRRHMHGLNIIQQEPPTMQDSSDWFNSDHITMGVFAAPKEQRRIPLSVRGRPAIDFE